MKFSAFYTDAQPTESGFYWVFSADYPVPQVKFLMNTPDRGWCIFGSGGYSHGMPFTPGTYRTVDVLQAPPVFVEEKKYPYYDPTWMPILEKCPDNQLPDGPTCPACGELRAPSGVDGGSWVHFPRIGR